ncbi:hypothetical protein SARI_02707 [Salmonella enterica subsp. arizonae serovar 62:z4,z23:-]|uniref:Uncharacterized protein n=1 Tax=Salmonella arizonae (strain ATCC BAA-731 / CDC346-86 / RSK2980) TaxID=41514 RepID=A9MNT1_SALAR|nr:hypothetical protein SARI_02707 [Salmonella enterica subsp. arizonae serovar 62:z4,z23:-]
MASWWPQGEHRYAWDKSGWLTGYEVWSKSRAERETHYNYAQRTGARRLNADGPA